MFQKDISCEFTVSHVRRNTDNHLKNILQNQNKSIY